MIDAFGVGICIACISYLCCICTTTIVACSALKRRKNGIKSCRGYSKPSSSSSRNRSSRVAVQQKQPTSSRAVKKCDSGSESRCPCAEKQQKYFSCCSPCTQPAKRKAYLETSSFLNFEDADLSVASGKCAKVAKGKRPSGGCGLGSNASTGNNNNNNHSFNDFQRFKNY